MSPKPYSRASKDAKTYTSNACSQCKRPVGLVQFTYRDHQHDARCCSHDCLDAFMAKLDAGKA